MAGLGPHMDARAHHVAAALPYSECYYFPAEGHLSLIVRYLEMVLASSRD